MKENSFVTQTDGKYVEMQIYKASFILFVLLSAAACLGFLLSWQAFVFFEVIVLIACVFSAVSGNRNHQNYQLQFENDRLFITNQATGSVYEVYDIPASDFVINQTQKEISTDHCSLMIKNTVFTFGCVEKCSELKQYISENYR